MACSCMIAGQTKFVLSRVCRGRFEVRQAVSHAEPAGPLAGLVSGVAQGILEGRTCQAAGLHPGAAGLANLASAAGHARADACGRAGPQHLLVCPVAPMAWTRVGLPASVCRSSSEVVPVEQYPPARQPCGTCWRLFLKRHVSQQCLFWVNKTRPAGDEAH